MSSTTPDAESEPGLDDASPPGVDATSGMDAVAVPVGRIDGDAGADGPPPASDGGPGDAHIADAGDATDSATTGRTVECDGAVCALDQDAGCCASNTTGSSRCTTQKQCTSFVFGGVFQECDEPGDCPAGNKCCSMFHYSTIGVVGAKCGSQCSLGAKNELCKNDTDCDSGHCRLYAGSIPVRQCEAPLGYDGG